MEEMTRLALGARRGRRLEELSDSQQLEGDLRPA